MKKSKVGKSPNNPVPERQFREALLNRAKLLGCHGDLIQIFQKYDAALKGCTNEQERKHIAACGSAEIHRLFDCTGDLTVDGQLLIPAENSNIKLIK